MLEVAYPYLFILLPLPVVLWFLLPSHREARPALAVPFMERLVRVTGRQAAPGAAVVRGSRIQKITLALGWLCLVTALARPQWVEDPITRTVPTRDLLLAVDLSGSMEVEDFKDAAGETVDRLTAVKQVLDDFLSRREGDRVGLIFFGSAAYVQAPFTEDLDVCRTLLDEAQVRMAGPQTMMGDAVGLAVHVFEEAETEERVLIVLTDGNDTGSRVPPDKAAAVARDKGITIHTVAVGDPKAAGEEKLDEDTLKTMASATGGGFFHANNRDELEEIYGRIDTMSTREAETISHRPRHDLFHWPLAAFLVIGLLYHLLRLLIAERKSGGEREAFPWLKAILVFTVGGAIALGLRRFTPGAFHFMRPEWLAALAVSALIAWLLARHGDFRRAWRGLIDERLLDHLLVEEQGRGRLKLWHLIGVAWLLAALALAGPTWKREPSPFVEDRAALFIIMKVTPSMKLADIQPSRLERTVHKVRDLLELRKGALTGLIAYSGSAHLVMPLTRDAKIVGDFAAELAPEIMPRDGDAATEAVALAEERLDRSGLPGSIVVIADAMEAGQADALSSRYPVHVLAVASEEDPGLVAAVGKGGGILARVAPDTLDVERLASRAERSMVTAPESGGGERWADFGFWLIPLIAVIMLVWFRPGWVVAYGA